MTLIIDSNTATLIELHGLTPSEHAFDVYSVAIATNTGGTTNDAVVGDATFRTYTGSTETIEAEVSTTAGFGSDPPTYTSRDTSIATVDSTSGRVTRISSGTARIKARSSKYAKELSVAVSQSVEASSEAFLSYTSGSLADTVLDYMSAAVDGTTFGGAGNPQALFSGTSWNPTCWLIAAGGKPYPCSYYKDQTPIESNSWGGCTAVHARFAIIAHHYYQTLGVTGARFYFKGSDNIDYLREVVSYTQISADIGIIRLDSDLPAVVGFAKVLPDDWEDYITSIPTTAPSPLHFHEEAALPIFRRNIQNRALMLDWYAAYESTGVLKMISCFSEANAFDAERAQYFQSGQSGDSSNGMCLVHPADGSLVLLAAMTNSTAGQAIFPFKAAITAAMHGMIPGAALTSASFSAYPNYG